ncbi:elements of external origin, partial [Cupriavidus sp. U2]
EWRKVSQSLTLQYDKTMYLLEDRPEHRGLIHRYIEVAEYPDGRVELWADGASLPYTTYHRFPEIDQGAVVENKRLGHVLAIAARVQALRDSRHQAGPSRTLSGGPPSAVKAPLNVKRQRLINRLDLERAIAGTDGPTLLQAQVPPASPTALRAPHKKHPAPHKKHARPDISI